MKFVTQKITVAIILFCVFALVQTAFADGDTTASKEPNTTNKEAAPPPPPPAPRVQGERRRDRDVTEFRMNGILETGVDIHRRTNSAGETTTESNPLARGDRASSCNYR